MMTSHSNTGGFKRNEVIVLTAPNSLSAKWHPESRDSSASLLTVTYAHEPKASPETLKGNGQRELKTSKSGFTYPSAKRRGR